MRPGAPIGQRPDRGRRPKQTETDAEDLAPKRAQPDNKIITQPRLPPSAQQIQIPADAAEIGSENNVTSPSLALSEEVSVTGPPPFQPFQQQISRQPPATGTPGLEPGREPLPPEVNGRLAPPVTKGAPNTTLAPSAGPQAGHQRDHLIDHDYFRQPTATSDHNYFAEPPPGFNYNQPAGLDYNQSHGRPQRTRNLPTRFSDYDLN